MKKKSKDSYSQKCTFDEMKMALCLMGIAGIWILMVWALWKFAELLWTI